MSRRKRYGTHDPVLASLTGIRCSLRLPGCQVASATPSNSTARKQFERSGHRSCNTQLSWGAAPSILQQTKCNHSACLILRILRHSQITLRLTPGGFLSSASSFAFRCSTGKFRRSLPLSWSRSGQPERPAKTATESNKPLTEAVKPPPSTLRRNPQPPPFPSVRGQRAKLLWTAHGVQSAPISQRFGR